MEKNRYRWLQALVITAAQMKPHSISFAMTMFNDSMNSVPVGTLFVKR